LCWQNPQTPAEIANGCTNATGVPLTVTLPCWDGGITATSNLPSDFPAPKNVSGWTCQ
jgi:hypothetical protein